MLSGSLPASQPSTAILSLCFFPSFLFPAQKRAFLPIWREETGPCTWAGTYLVTSHQYRSLIQAYSVCGWWNAHTSLQLRLLAVKNNMDPNNGRDSTCSNNTQWELCMAPRLLCLRVFLWATNSWSEWILDWMKLRDIKSSFHNISESKTIILERWLPFGFKITALHCLQ